MVPNFLNAVIKLKVLKKRLPLIKEPDDKLVLFMRNHLPLINDKKFVHAKSFVTDKRQKVGNIS